MDSHSSRMTLYLTVPQTDLIDLALFWKRASTTRRGKAGLVAIAGLMALAVL